MKSKTAGNFALAKQYVSQTPNAPALTIAKRMYADHPERFSGIEAARSNVRAILGTNGCLTRKLIADKSAFREPRQPGQVFDSLPEPKSCFDAAWCHFEMQGKCRALVLQDIHIPFHELEPLNVAISEGRRRKCDTIILNGDTADFYSLSDWDKTPNKARMLDEVNSIIQLLGYIRGKFPKARIIWKDGNHEERFWRYLKVKAAEFWGLEIFTLRKILELDDYGIEYIGEMRPIKLGKMYLLHGHEYKFQISNPVNPARGLFRRAKTHALCGHFHQSSQHSDRDLSEKVITCWSTGCLCDLHPAYRPLNNWSHGFAIIDTDDTGAFQVDNLRIIDGRIY